MTASHAGEQSARWLSNTFRIDPSISSITLLIERETATTPVVLIRPDGSKYYYQDHPDNVSWAATANRDVITLWQPEPGPWQATGKINRHRGISLLSVFEVQLAPLPERIFQHEVFKLDAELRHQDTRLDANYYLKDLSLRAQLIKPDKDETSAFAPVPLVIGDFADDGTGLDAYPSDGKLTAEVLVDTLPGEYLFQAQISNRVLARTHEQPVLVYPMPVTLGFSTPDANGKWQMKVTAASVLLPDSLVVTGELTTPDRQSMAVSGTGANIRLPDAVDPGNYYWQGRAFATTREGREVQLNLMEQVIRVSPPVSVAAVETPPVKTGLSMIYLLAGITLLTALLATGWFLRKKIIGRRKNSPEQQS
ncbi:TIGR03503 family protein [Oceanisphaera sediminis]|uniref:TIGR03503 family protein n=1 Tax=Oceanisphaera sediminis TaxID=981381 RepID=A0ABP7E8F6_9GAMM